MKLKRIISCVLTIIMISGTITLVNAADTKLVVGTPINLSNEDADVLSTGDIIAIPVDVIVGGESKAIVCFPIFFIKPPLK